MDIRNKNILITGAAGGLGKELSKKLSDLDANLVLIDINKDQLFSLKNCLKNSNKHEVFAADLTQSSSIKKIKERCENRKEKIDILINSAGVMNFSSLENIDQKSTNFLININLIAPIAITNALLKGLKEKKEAIILNIGSTFGSIGYPGFSIYGASKAGLKGFSESLRRELLDTNIKIIHFSPRAINTSLNNDSINKLNKELKNNVDEPEEIAQEIVKSCVRHYGWPEKLYVVINQLLPKIIDQSIKTNLKTIKNFF
jgi:short-subunit dehydrogenase